jgi:hypothetical protein
MKLERSSGAASCIRGQFGTPPFSVLWKSTSCDSGPFYEADVIAGIGRLNGTLARHLPDGFGIMAHVICQGE